MIVLDHSLFTLELQKSLMNRFCWSESLLHDLCTVQKSLLDRFSSAGSLFIHFFTSESLQNHFSLIETYWESLLHALDPSKIGLAQK